MRSKEIDVQLLRRQILRAAPVLAYARPPLDEFLRANIGAIRASPRLILKNIIDGGCDYGLMCRFTIEGDRQARSFVAPLNQLSLGRESRAASPLARGSRLGTPQRMD